MYSLIIRPLVRNTLVVVVAAAMYLIAPSQLSQESQLLFGWNMGATVLLGVLLVMMSRSDGEQAFQQAQSQAPSHFLSVMLAMLTAVICMVGTASMLNNTKQMTVLQTHLHLGLSMYTVISAWLIVHTYFALHYTRLYYDKVSSEDTSFMKGLDFPGQGQPDYWDFMYYSLTIAMCFSTSDVTTTTTVMRRFSLFHAVVSFFFVTFVIGLVVGVVQNVL